MAGIGEVAVGYCGQGSGCEPLRARARGNRRPQRALRAGAMAHPHPVTEPARQRRERYIASQWLTIRARRLSRAVVGDRDEAVEQRQEAVVLVEYRQKVGDGHEGSKPDTPTVAMGGAVEQSIAR